MMSRLNCCTIGIIQPAGKTVHLKSLLFKPVHYLLEFNIYNYLNLMEEELFCCGILLAPPPHHRDMAHIKVKLSPCLI
jgi:hypothetical protein